MQLSRSLAAAADLRFVDEAVSTNDSLAALAVGRGQPHFSVLGTLSQTGGRGRLGRTWIAPPGKTLAVSVLLRPILPTGLPLGMNALGWLPLLAGAAMTASIAELVPRGRTTLKWPNDVLIDGRKVCGILAELQPDGSVVVGSGINLTLSTDELPVPTATSLELAEATEFGDKLVDAVLGGYLERLAVLVDRLAAANGDAEASGLLAEVSAACSTLGSRVRVELPGGDALVGTATALDSSGRLVVEANGALQAVAAGDVTHLRYE